MSLAGIKKAAALFSSMQQLRGELLNMGSQHAKTKSGKQDILLGQMLETGKEAMKDDFMRITNADVHDMTTCNQCEGTMKLIYPGGDNLKYWCPICGTLRIVRDNSIVSNTTPEINKKGT